MASTQSVVDSDSQRVSWSSVALRAVVSKPRKVLLGLVAGLVLGAGVSFLLPDTYTAHATFIPPSNNSASSAMLSQLGALTGMGGGLGGAKDPGAVYMGILSSRTVADAIIAQFNLKSVYKRDKLSQLEKVLASHIKVMENKDTMIAVSVDDQDPKRAADLTNALLKELMRQNDRLAVTEASQRRAYFERQITKEKDALADAEVALTVTEQKTGLVHPTAQTQVQIQAVAQTQAQIANREIQLAALEQTETAANPDIVRLRSELSALRTVLSRQEGEDGGKGDSVMAPMAKAPELQQEYLRKQRDLKFHESLFELLLRQYETAKLDEARSAPLIQIVDEAVVPDSKSGPQRKMIAIVFGLLGLLIASGLVVARALARKWRMDNPDQEPIFGGRLLRMIAGNGI